MRSSRHCAQPDDLVKKIRSVVSRRVCETQSIFSCVTGWHRDRLSGKSCGFHVLSRGAKAWERHQRIQEDPWYEAPMNSRAVLTHDLFYNRELSAIVRDSLKQ